MRKSAIQKAESMIGKVNDRYSIRASEVIELYDFFKDSPIEMISSAFRYGYMQGMKAAKAEIKQKGGVVNA